MINGIWFKDKEIDRMVEVRTDELFGGNHWIDAADIVAAMAQGIADKYEKEVRIIGVLNLVIMPANKSELTPPTDPSNSPEPTYYPRKPLWPTNLRMNDEPDPR